MAEYESSELDQQFEMDSREVSADRMIAMNPSGSIEMYQNEGDHEGEDQGEECPGGVCPVEEYTEEEMTLPANAVSKPAPVGTPWTTYLMYVVLLLVILAVAYFGYKYFVCKE